VDAVSIDMSRLDMGIWSDDGTIWLPKALYPTRSEAKMWYAEQMTCDYIDVRCRTRWMRVEPDPDYRDMPYVISEKDAEGAFECWELT
jgi:hypothetical protein